MLHCRTRLRTFSAEIRAQDARACARAMPVDLFAIPSIWDYLPHEVEANKKAKRRIQEENEVRAAKRRGVELIIIDSEADMSTPTDKIVDLFVDDVPYPEPVRRANLGQCSRARG